MFRTGDKIAHLTILKEAGRGQHLVCCDCGSEPFVAWDNSLRRGTKRACFSCSALERKCAREAAAARKEAERKGARFLSTPDRPRFEWQGNEDALAEMNVGVEKEQHAQSEN